MASYFEIWNIIICTLSHPLFLIGAPIMNAPPQEGLFQLAFGEASAFIVLICTSKWSLKQHEMKRIPTTGVDPM